MKKFTIDLTTLPPLDDIYVQAGLSSVYTLKDYPHIYHAPATLFKEGAFFKTMVKRFGDANAVYLKNPPHSCYNWHQDVIRLSAFNWLVKHPVGAATYFSYPYDADGLTAERTAAGRDSLYVNLEKIDYSPDYPVVLDVRGTHGVFNDTDEERIILSLSIYSATFDEVAEFVKTLNITSYQ